MDISGCNFTFRTSASITILCFSHDHILGLMLMMRLSEKPNYVYYVLQWHEAFTLFTSATKAFGNPHDLYPPLY